MRTVIIALSLTFGRRIRGFHERWSAYGPIGGIPQVEIPIAFIPPDPERQIPVCFAFSFVHLTGMKYAPASTESIQGLIICCYIKESMDGARIRSWH